jgi:putative flippase GtrA
VKALRRPALDLRTRRQLWRYAAIGAFCVTIDVAAFRSLSDAGWMPELAAVVGGAVSMAVHFALNKYVNFRSHDRSLGAQLGTYCAVTSVWWVVTLGVVALLTRGLGVPPVAAKLVAVAVNFPLGFIAQRSLTFGPGIAAMLRRLRAAA